MVLVSNFMLLLCIFSKLFILVRQVSLYVLKNTLYLHELLFYKLHIFFLSYRNTQAKCYERASGSLYLPRQDKKSFSRLPKLHQTMLAAAAPALPQHL
ncbi:hypothetical protein LINGRAHAP2_LOCUS35512, partial [Linum grandiflorum]